MSEDKTMVQQCFSEIGKRLDKTSRSLRRITVPYDCEVEYVQTDRTNYIDTGLLFNGTVQSAFVTASAPSSINQSLKTGEYSPRVFGYSVTFGSNSSRSGSAFPCFRVKNQQICGYMSLINYGDGSSSNAYSDSLTDFGESFHSFYIAGLRCGVDVFDNTKTLPTISNTTLVNEYSFPFLIGGYYEASSLEQLTPKICSISLRIKNVLLINTLEAKIQFEGIPVKKDDVGYIYDKVSGNLFGSAVGSPLIAGPDINLV